MRGGAGVLAGTAPRVPTTVIVLSDVGQMQEAVKGANLEITQLDRGLFRGRLVHAVLEGMGFSAGTTNLRSRTRGQSSPLAWTLAVTLKAPHPARLWGQPHSGGGLALYPPLTENDGVYPPGFTYAALTVAPEELAATGDTVAPELGELSTWRRRVAAPQPDAARILGRLFQEAITMVVSTPAFSRVGIAHTALKEELLHAYLHTLVAAAGEKRDRLWPTLSSDVRIVRRVEEYLECESQEPVSVQALTRRCGVPRRTLNRAFHRLLDMGPGTYLRRQRLSGAKRDLSTVELRGASVTDIALRHGFWHLGRFAVEYRQMFGESPSETLRKPR